MKEERAGVLVGARPVSAALRRYLPADAFVVAADAGWRGARQLGLAPQLVVGDFDSSEPPALAELPPGAEILRLPTHKDDTDGQYAAARLLQHGCTSAVLLGMLGGRRDHTMAAMATLFFLQRAGCTSLLADEHSEIRCVLPGTTLRLPRQPGRYLSVFPAEGVARGVQERGVAYPLQDATLNAWTPLGVSNEWDAEVAEIGSREGALFVLTVERDG